MTNIVALTFLKEAAKRGWTFKVDGGGEDWDYVGNKPLAVWHMVKEVTEATVAVYDATGKQLGAALLMAPGPMTCDNDETIVDYSANGPVGELADKLIAEVL